MLRTDIQELEKRLEHIEDRFEYPYSSNAPWVDIENITNRRYLELLTQLRELADALGFKWQEGGRWVKNESAPSR